MAVEVWAQPPSASAARGVARGVGRSRVGELERGSWRAADDARGIRGCDATGQWRAVRDVPGAHAMVARRPAGSPLHSPVARVGRRRVPRCARLRRHGMPSGFGRSDGGCAGRSPCGPLGCRRAASPRVERALPAATVRRTPRARNPAGSGRSGTIAARAVPAAALAVAVLSMFRIRPRHRPSVRAWGVFTRGRSAGDGGRRGRGGRSRRGGR